jgi:CRISPR-associated protein Csx10
MKQIQLGITALSPLAIGRQKPGGSVSEAESYIPGSVIRGAIAGVILQQAERVQPELRQQAVDLSQNGGDFQSLFLEDTAAIFCNAYPASAEDVAIEVLPETAVSSKTEPGFATAGSSGVFDTLIDRFCAQQCSYPYDPSPIDGGRLEAFGGFYSHTASSYCSYRASTRLLTRVGINRRRATAEEQVLYSLEVLNEVQSGQPAFYQGKILVPDDRAQLLADFINAHDFRLGGSTSRGLGRVELTATAIDRVSTLEQRWHQFNQTLQQRWQQWGEVFPTSPLNRSYFTLNLQADAILTEQWRHTTVISPEMLRQFTGISNDSSLQFHTAYSSYDYRSGWNAAWGLMKDVELVTSKGGTYLFSIAEDEEQTWLEKLAELELKGVGDRTSEGFGQVQICSPFHCVLREEAA